MHLMCNLSCKYRKKIFYCTTGAVEFILKKNDKFKKGFGYMFEEKIQEKYRIPNMV